MELLSPVGDLNSFYQAINNGADAVYLAGKKFGARAYAPNFSVSEIKDLIKEAHILGVKVYVTVNTLLKDKEISEALNFIKDIYEAGVDAIIMQDIGLMSIVSEMMPSLAIHASTNMSINSIDKIKELEELGVKRVILARETSIDEIKEIKKHTNMELEVFIHGALCMCYSGACLLSSAIGKRSGNRGTCAQACRMEYTLKKNGEPIKKKYYLSPRDLCTIDNIEELKELGITSLKIEGRMKRAEYIGVITSSYRKAIDNHLDEKEIERLKTNMALMFNRGFTKGYLFNETNKHFTNVSSSSHIGVEIGEVKKYRNQYAFIKLSGSLNANDSIRIVGKMGDAITINEMFVNGVKSKHAKSGDEIQVRCHNEVSVPSRVLKTTDSMLLDNINKVSPKKIHIEGRLYYDDAIKLDVFDGKNKVSVVSSFPYTKAESSKMAERLKDQLYKTADSSYVFDKVSVEGSIFMPIKEINELRRKALLELDLKRNELKERIIKPLIKKEIKTEITNNLYVEVKTKEQVEALLNKDVIVLTRDKSLASFYKDSVTYISPRINKDRISCKLIDNYKNVLNAFSAAYFFMHGAKCVGVSVEASYEGIKELVYNFKNNFKYAPNLMVEIYGKEELMVMKHCLICKEMGHLEKGCGECLKNTFSLVDKMKEEYALVNDGACNLVLLNSKVLNLTSKVAYFEKCGVTNFKVTLSNETKEETERIINGILNHEELHFKNETLGYFNEEVI